MDVIQLNAAFGRGLLPSTLRTVIVLKRKNFACRRPLYKVSFEQASVVPMPCRISIAAVRISQQFDLYFK
jgi:hypothetical protein